MATNRELAFETNMADAELLVRWAVSIKNARQRRERKELRRRMGVALDIPQKRRDDIAIVESNDLSIVIKPDSAVSRADFADTQPLLRQAVVAGCAATETFLSDLVMDFISEVTAAPGQLPKRLAETPIDSRPMAADRTGLQVPTSRPSREGSSGLRHQVRKHIAPSHG